MSFISVETLAYAGAWATSALMGLSLVPQFILNARLRSVKGLSPSGVMLLYAGTIIASAYVWFLEFPLPYRFFSPIRTVLLAGTLIQGVLYSTSEKQKVLYLRSLIGITTFAALLWAVGLSWNKKVIGQIAGWIQVGPFFLYTLPQIAHIFKQGHTKGFSLGSVLFSLGSTSIALFCALFFNLPLQTLLNTIWTLCCLFIQIFQFVRFREERS